ncbi:hypothetical protein SAMN05216337_1008149 [Bradyrhizobium brasilense]|uniref:Uncharacterized protein n=1 Tax=Bradyrhizobium brasilense TaxID=1419277 RepID=A0A1G6SNT4_9BRAD|nr:hypothetical protein SAMN05216337_1008149 [Bradyrhizobium brasilense]
MHGGALEIGPPSPPQSVMPGGNGAKPQGPACKKPNSGIHHMIARDDLFNRPGSLSNAIAYLLDGV